jgi:hypothetical protein
MPQDQAATVATSAFLEELRWRGLLDAVRSDDLDVYLAAPRRTLYVGFDPTADCAYRKLRLILQSPCNNVGFFADCAAKKWPLPGQLPIRVWLP